MARAGSLHTAVLNRLFPKNPQPVPPTGCGYQPGGIAGLIPGFRFAKQAFTRNAHHASRLGSELGGHASQRRMDAHQPGGGGAIN